MRGRHRLRHAMTRTPRPNASPRAFTLIDVLVVMAVLSIVLFAVIPAFSRDDRTRLVAAANLFTADLQNARMLTVQDPGDPVRVVVSPAGAGWHLSRHSDPDTPMTLPTGVGGDWRIVFGEGPASNLWSVRLAPQGVDPVTILAGALPFVRFDAFGRLAPAVDTRFELSTENDSLIVRVRADTGDAHIE